VTVTCNGVPRLAARASCAYGHISSLAFLSLQRRAFGWQYMIAAIFKLGWSTFVILGAFYFVRSLTTHVSCCPPAFRCPKRLRALCIVLAHTHHLKRSYGDAFVLALLSLTGERR
jgi:hypothetical protein